MSPQLHRAGDLVTKILSTFFTSVLTAKVCFHGPQTIGNVWSEDDLLLVEEEKAREHLSRWSIRNPWDLM